MELIFSVILPEPDKISITIDRGMCHMIVHSQNHIGFFCLDHMIVCDVHLNVRIYSFPSNDALVLTDSLYHAPSNNSVPMVFGNASDHGGFTRQYYGTG